MEKKVRKVDLDSEETRKDLRNFHDLIQQSYGPFGRCALFTSPMGGGGVVCLTSRSEKILQMLKTKSLFTKLVVDNVQAHVSNYKDSGLYAALLATKLIMSGLSVQKPRYQVATVTSHILSLVAEWLQSDTCPCKRTLSLTSTQELMMLVCSSIISKALKFGVSTPQVSHLSSLLLQAFLHVLPSTKVQFYSFPAHVHVLAISGHPLEESVLIHGVAIAINDRQLLAQVEGESLKRDDERGILTAIFDISLAGNLEEDLHSGWNLLASQASLSGRGSVESVGLERLLALSAGLVAMGVGMMGCQKCVHPLVKEGLREQGVLVVERLSSVHIDSVREVTGGQMNSLINPTSVHLGRLKKVSVATVATGDRFLVLEGCDDSSSHSTLVLCTPTETVGDELLPLCKNTISLLEQSLTSQYSFYGGGCTNTTISHMITEMATGQVQDEILEELECDQDTYQTVVKSIARCFSSTAGSLEHHGGQVLTDSAHHHCWSFPPYDYCTPLSADQSGTSTPQPSEKQSGGDNFFSRKCCCGSLTLRNLPSGTKLTDAISRDSISVPDAIHRALEQLIGDQTPFLPESGSAQLLDFGLAKLKAVEAAGDIASTVLQITYSLSEP